MCDLRMMNGEIWNFGKLNSPNVPGELRMIQTPRGDEIRWVIVAK